MRSVAGVALIAPARGRASKKIINIMHTGAARCFWKPKWPWVKTKPPKPAKPPKPSTTGRAVCNARFLLRKVHVSGAYPVRAPKGAPDRKPTPNAETWESRPPSPPICFPPLSLSPPPPLPLPLRLPVLVRPGHPAPAATLPAIPAADSSGAQDYRWFVRDPLGLTPPGYESGAPYGAGQGSSTNAK